MLRASAKEFVEIFDLESQTSAWGLAVGQTFGECPAADRPRRNAAVRGGFVGRQPTGRGGCGSGHLPLPAGVLPAILSATSIQPATL